VPHELMQGPESIELSVTASSREEMFREALAGVLEAAYDDRPAEGPYGGRVVPVQAAGSADDVLLAGLVDDTLRAAREEAGTLRPPRWLAFDERRVTATLPLHEPKSEARSLELGAAEVVAGDGLWTARLELRVVPPR
jgi:hypothetical protein